ncbi:hypothetical protein C7M84_005679 [Penaeus vannamei]|uniref:Nitrate/nitrite sensing protein domain-containing protein n=1 Tax=Penaeus vannamei TaxID=6689 RepID=A0A3R7MGE4_PENVA|nr:hypothetical protein C7M84_005679 [Penaeus vannamei]
MTWKAAHSLRRIEGPSRLPALLSLKEHQLEQSYEHSQTSRKSDSSEEIQNYDRRDQNSGICKLEFNDDANSGNGIVQISTGLGNVTEALQSERAEIAFYLFTNGSVIRRNLSEHFAYTNSLIDNLKWPKFRIEDPLFKNKILFRIRLDDFRDKITKFDTPSIDAGIKFYNRANYIFLDQLTREIKEKDSSGVWRPLLAYKNLIRAIEHLGISMVFGEEYFGRGDLDHTSYLNFVTNDALGQDFLNASKSFAYWIKDRYLQLQQTYPWYSNITRRRQEIINRVKIEPDFDKATEYFYAMLGYLDALQKIQYEIRTRIEETILSEVGGRGFLLLLSLQTLSPLTSSSPLQTLSPFTSSLLLSLNPYSPLQTLFPSPFLSLTTFLLTPSP